MHRLFKYICFTLLLNIIPTSGKSLLVLIHSNPKLNSDETVPILRSGSKISGIFVTFLENYLNLLIHGFPEKRLNKYCKMLSSLLKEMGYKHAKKLGNVVRDLYHSEIKEELISYREELHKDLPHRREFLTAMNEVFTPSESVLFNDYIIELQEYANKDKLSIDVETYKILSMIVNSVFKLSRRDRKQLEKKLRKAISEYKKAEFDSLGWITQPFSADINFI